MRTKSIQRLVITVLLTVLINGLPLLGVLALGWSLFDLLFIYWLESLIVGLSNFCLIAVANGDWRSRISKMIFFTVHYGGFWLAHGFFLIIVLFPAIEQASGAGEGLATRGMTVTFWGLVASYGLTTLLQILRTKKGERLSPTAQMFVPYGRVFVLHIVILGGAWAAAKYASALVVLLLFIALKTLFDFLMGWISYSARETARERSMI